MNVCLCSDKPKAAWNDAQFCFLTYGEGEIAFTCFLGVRTPARHTLPLLSRECLMFLIKHPRVTGEDNINKNIKMILLFKNIHH